LCPKSHLVALNPFWLALNPQPALHPLQKRLERGLAVVLEGLSDSQPVPFMKTLSIVALALILASLSGCAAKKPVMVWRFTHCAHSGAAMVCECSVFHTLLDAKTGGLVRVCD
jgi:hypothetical protein